MAWGLHHQDDYGGLTRDYLHFAVATFNLTFDNTTAVCMPFLVPPAPPPPPPDAEAPAAILAAAPQGGSNAGLIGGIVGGVLAAAAISAGIVGFLLWRRRRRREEEVKALEAAKVPSSHTVQSPAPGFRIGCYITRRGASFPMLALLSL